MMKFKNLILSLALMLFAPFAKANDGCREKDKYDDLNKIVKELTNVPCFEGKNLKKDYKEVCGCVKNLPKMDGQEDDNIKYFEQRISQIMLANTITSATSISRDNSDEFIPNSSTSRKERKELEDRFSFGNSKRSKVNLNKTNPGNSVLKAKTEQENDYRNMIRECGYNIDEYRRMSRVPTFKFMDTEAKELEEDNITTKVLWNEYLKKNPELMAIDVNLPNENRIQFRKDIMNRMREIRNSTPFARMFGEQTGETVNGELLIEQNQSRPQNSLWIQVDKDFEDKNGVLKGIVKKYKDISQPIYDDLLEKSGTIRVSEKNGFKPNFKYISENPWLWDLYFKEDSSAGTGCGLRVVTDRKSSLEALSCIKNVGGFCGLYEKTKDIDPKDLVDVSKLDFSPLIEIEAAVDKTSKEHRAQTVLICKTKAKMGHVLDSKGKPVEDLWSIDDFKKHFCEIKDVRIGNSLSPTISENEMDVACSSKPRDNARLQGFYQRMLDGEEYRKIAGKMFNSDEFRELKISTMRSYLREKSKFDIQTKNIEDNVTEAVSSGTAKKAAKIFTERMTSDNGHMVNLKNRYAGVESVSTATVVPDRKILDVSSSTFANPSDLVAASGSPFVAGSGFSPTATRIDASAAQNHQQIVSEETKKMAETKQQIENLEDKKSDLPASNSKDSEFDKQIQDLKNQLASSEVRYQAAVEAIKKSNPSAVLNNDKSLSGTSSVQRTIASTPVSNATNIIGPAGNTQVTSSGGSTVSSPANFVTDNVSANGMSTNRALLQANNVDLSFLSGKANKEFGLVLNTVRNEKNEEIGVITDPKVYEAFKKDDPKTLDRYIQEMRDKNLEILLVRSGNEVFYYKLIVDKNENFSLRKEVRVISSEERKYFKKDLTNIINSGAHVGQ